MEELGSIPHLERTGKGYKRWNRNSPSLSRFVMTEHECTYNCIFQQRACKIYCVHDWVEPSNTQFCNEKCTEAQCRKCGMVGELHMKLGEGFNDSRTI